MKARPMKEIPQRKMNRHLRRYHYEPPSEAEKVDTENPPILFVHIPKTAGTRLGQLITHNLAETGVPRNLFYSAHRYSAYDLAANYGPNRKLALVIRDPVDRFVSAFYSRFHKGAPDYNTPWFPDEEVFFAKYPTLRALVWAMVFGQRQKMQKQLKKVHLVHMGYVRFFGSPAGLEQDWENIVVCLPMQHLDAQLDEVMARLGFESFEEPVKKKENRGLPRPKVSRLERIILRRFLADEYEIYDRLLERSRELHDV